MHLRKTTWRYIWSAQVEIVTIVRRKEKNDSIHKAIKIHYDQRNKMKDFFKLKILKLIGR
jgi:hypothetical protein